jgi:glycosyltransferase involved in cell wall biosynthesis
MIGGICILFKESVRIGLIAPGDLSTRGGYTVKVYLEAEILSLFGKVSLYAYNLKQSSKYECVDLSTITSYSRSVSKSLRVYWALCNVITRSKFDYVFIPTVFNPLFPVLFLASKLASSKIIYDFRDPLYGTIATMKDEVYSRTGNRILAWFITKLSYIIEAILIRSSDYILTVSPLLVDYVKKFKKRNQGNIFLYHNYLPSEVNDIQPDKISPALQKAIHEKIVICYLGHIQTQIRGIEGIFTALKNSTNNNIFLILMGEIDNRLYWKSLIEKLGCDDKILILDPRPKPEALGYLIKFDYGILGPSPSNSLPSKVFDTLSVGVKFILPANMSSAIQILGNYGVTYQDYADLKRLFDGLEKPIKKLGLSDAKKLVAEYSLHSRLESIFRDIFHVEH